MRSFIRSPWLRCVPAVILLLAASGAFAEEHLSFTITAPEQPMYVLQGQTVVVHWEYWEDPDNPYWTTTAIGMYVGREFETYCYALSVEATPVAHFGDCDTPIPQHQTGDFSWNTAGFEGAYVLMLSSNMCDLEDGYCVYCSCLPVQYPDLITVLLEPPAPIASISAATVNSGESYTVSWYPTVCTTGYEVQESTSPSFDGAVTHTVTGADASSKTFQTTTATDVNMHYRVRAIHSGAGVNSDWSAEVYVHVIGIPLSVGSRGEQTVPEAFRLEPNFPNPFNPGTKIHFGVDAPGTLSLIIVNSLGQTVRVLREGYCPAGSYEAEWNGLDDSGKTAGSGIYQAVLRQGGRTVVRKMLKIE